MSRMSREKGARGERELAKELSKIFAINARRGQQYQGSPDSPDVVAFDGIHIECKRTERLQLYSAMAQAIDDAGDSVPVVAHRKNREDWLMIVRLSDLPELARILKEYVTED